MNPERVEEQRRRIVVKGRKVELPGNEATPARPVLLALSRPEPPGLAKLGSLTELGGLIAGLNFPLLAMCLFGAAVRSIGGGETPFGPLAVAGTLTGLTLALLLGGFVWTRARRLRYGAAEVDAHEVRVTRSWGKRVSLPLAEVGRREVTPHGVLLLPLRPGLRARWRAWWAPVLIPTQDEAEVHTVIQLLERLESERAAKA